MSLYRQHFTEVLRERGLTAEQLAETEVASERTGARLRDLLVQLGFVTELQVLAAIAEASGVALIDLREIVLPLAVLEQMPESVARENCVLPLAYSDRSLTLAVTNPDDLDLLQKLSFILNRPIQPMLAPRQQILDAIDRHYGSAETESVDSMLMEFTDTAIDFTETDTPVVAEPPRNDTAEWHCEEPTPREVARRATVRHYHRMNPERTFPLLVVLSEKEIRAVVKKGVGQNASGPFQVAEGSVVEVEPVLPGCACFPPRQQVAVRPGNTELTFWIVPHVLGRVMQARVVVRQGDRVLAEVPLEMRVTRQALTAMLGVLTCLLPLLFIFLRHYRLDLESQLADGFDLYTAVAAGLLRWLSPGVVAGMLLLATGCAYFCLRPRQRDVFFEVEPLAKGEQSNSSSEPKPVPVRSVAREETTLARAERLYADRDYASALRCYQDALGLGRSRAILYHRAALAAVHTGDAAEGLAILEEAAARLAPRQMAGVMWYNMGCLATRTGRFDEAVQYLNRAVDAGFTHADKYRRDPDLEPLRWRPAFKTLLASLGDRVAR